MFIRFEIQPTGEGSFRYPEDPYFRLVEELDTALESRDRGDLSRQAYQATLERLIEEAPDFIDAHAHLGNVLFENGKTKKALDACRRGIEVGERLIPEGFSGPIPWIELDNRPFLRALYGAALANIRLRRHKEAVALMERLLALNPNDNQGVRLVLGTGYLRIGKIEPARALFSEEAGYYPPYFYDLALSYLSEQDWVRAATALRRGFCTTPYVAVMLLGNPEPRLLAIWHSSNLAGAEVAADHVAATADLWQRQYSALPFLHWLYHHPRILAERAAAMEPLEQLLWEHDIARRGKLLEIASSAVERIDDSLSTELVVKRTDYRGRSLFPWFHPIVRGQT